MSKIRNALFITVVTQNSLQVINLAFTIILARLITPSELGVYAISSSATILATELRAMGIGPYLVRETNLDTQKIRSATGLMIIISGGLGILIFILAPLAGHFYQEPALTTLLWITAITFFLAPYSTIPNALITREMKFNDLFVIRVVSMLVQTGSTLGLVMAGFSYYGLAWGIALGAISEFSLNNVYRPKGTPWIPSFKGIRGLLKFGAYLSVSQLFVRFSESISDLVIGKVGSKADVGLFSRGFGFLLFLHRILGLAIAPMVLPYLSEIKRDGGSVKDAYVRIMVLQGAVTLPVFAVVNLAAFPSIRLMFGDQWDAAIPIAAIMSLWAIFQSIHGFSSSALISMGEEKMMFLSYFYTFVVRWIAVIIACIAVSPFSLEAVAWSYAISGVLELAIKAWALRKSMFLGFRVQFSSMIPNMGLVLICWSAAWLLDHFMHFERTAPWKVILTLAIVMPPVWFAGLLGVRHELAKIILNLLRSRLLGRSAA